MCRIVGFKYFNSNNFTNSENIIHNMRDTMTKGGPDDSGLFIDKNDKVALGHRRLSIIDLSYAGHQPMITKDSKIAIVFNGEIYNFLELKKDLSLKGYKFFSNTDTEVLLYMYREFGVNMLKKLRGMFAFTIFDKEKDLLLLARDRIGIKPLYYYYENGVFIFSSQLKALLKHPLFSKRINRKALNLYLRFGYIPSPYSIFKNTFKLLPGHYLTLNHNGDLKIYPYFEIHNPKEKNIETAEAIERLENLLINSLKYRLIADVPVGVFLSGGIDSTLITVLLQKITTDIKTFTIGFNESKFDESVYAKNIANYLGTDHNELIVNSHNIIELFKEFPTIFDEPFADTSGIPTFLVSKMASKKVKVVLSADGGDELFAGYNNYYTMKKIENFAVFFKLLPKNLKIPFKEDATQKIKKIREVLNYNSDWERFLSLESFFSIEELTRLTQEKSHYDLRFMFEKINFLKNFKSENKIEIYELLDLKNYLPDDILVKVDRATMENSIEGREPLLDLDVLKFATKLPFSLKYKNGITKYILKKLLSKHLPNDLFMRPKHGFSIPLNKWFREEDSLKKLAEFYMSKDATKKFSLLNPNSVGLLYKNFKLYKNVSANKIWIIISLHLWAERWLS